MASGVQRPAERMDGCQIRATSSGIAGHSVMAHYRLRRIVAPIPSELVTGDIVWHLCVALLGRSKVVSRRRGGRQGRGGIKEH